ERDGCSLEVTAALRAVGPATVLLIELLFHARQLVALRAIEPGHVRGIRVQLDDVFGSDARGLMQIVDVLRHDARRLARVIEASERLVTAPRFCGAEMFLHRKTPPPGF